MFLISKYANIPFYDSSIEFVDYVPQFRSENNDFNGEMKMFSDRLTGDLD